MSADWGLVIGGVGLALTFHQSWLARRHSKASKTAAEAARVAVRKAVARFGEVRLADYLRRLQTTMLQLQECCARDDHRGAAMVLGTWREEAAMLDGATDGLDGPRVERLRTSVGRSLTYVHISLPALDDQGRPVAASTEQLRQAMSSVCADIGAAIGQSHAGPNPLNGLLKELQDGT